MQPELVSSFLESQMPMALEMLRKMVSINSFTANPAGVNEVARVTAEIFAPLGFSAEYHPAENPDFGNHLYLRRPGAGKHSVAMISHLDTVFPAEEEARNNFAWLEEGDRIYGPGTHDIKGGTVMMWLVLSALREHAREVFELTDWRLFLNAAEERYSPDFGTYCRKHLAENTLGALVYEAEGRVDGHRKLVLARKGRATWRISVSGRGAHAGSKHAYGANAIVQLGSLMERVAELTDYNHHLTVNVATIQGGTVLNRVPHEAFAEGEFRAFDPGVYSRARQALLALAGPGKVTSAADGFACEVRVEILTESGPWPRNPGTDKLFALWKGAGEKLGVPVGGEERGGLSDDNLLWDAVPTLDGLGPWGDNDHCSERSPDGSKLPEYVEVSSFVPKALLNVAAIVELVAGSTRR